MKNISFKKSKFSSSKTSGSLLPKIVIVIVTVFSVYYLFSSNLLTIKKVNVKLFNINCADEQQVRNISNLNGQSIILLTQDKVSQNITHKFICIRAVNLVKKYPDSIVLEAFGRQPALLLTTFTAEASISAVLSYGQSLSTQSANLNERFLIDDQGVIFAKASDRDSQILLYTQGSVNVGQTIEKDAIQKIIKNLDKAKLFGLLVQNVWLYSGKFLLLNSEPKIALSLDNNKDLNTQLASLQLILDKAKIDSVKIDFIDLRFDKAVVKYLPKKNE